MVFVIVGTGCGRIAFDPLGDARSGDSAVGDGAMFDAAVFPPPCSVRTMVDDPLRISGTTIQFQMFRSTYVDIATVSVVATESSQVLGAMTTNAQGDFILDLPTGGSAISPLFTISKPGFTTTYRSLNTPVDTGRINLLEIADNATMNALYALGPYTRRADRGTLVVQSLNCGGTGEAGATFTVDPAPEGIGYFNAGGTLSGSATQLPNVAAVMFNAVPGPNLITGTGQAYYPHTVDVMVGAQTVTSMMSIE
ncbi:MAG: hypothetical protein JWP01_2997 [Myxococcales bacterium]|nr:hypothetical protein [Myxococcales bacterium]